MRSPFLVRFVSGSAYCGVRFLGFNFCSNFFSPTQICLLLILPLRLLLGVEANPRDSESGEISSDYEFAMDAVCKRISVTENCSEEGFQNQVLGKGYENLGLKVEAVPRNSAENHYCSSCNLGCRTGDKKGTDSTWLVDAVGCGAVILTACKAEKFILVNNNDARRRKKCLGVVATSLNTNFTKKLQIEAKATISACGSLLTPLLMISSGFKNLNIGRNLHLHPVLVAWGYFPEDASAIKGKILSCNIIPKGIRKGAEGKNGEISNIGSPFHVDQIPGFGGSLTKESLQEFLDNVPVEGSLRSKDEYRTMYFSAHQMGSCRMGATEEEGAVDENDQSWEAEGLFVCNRRQSHSDHTIHLLLHFQED
ncbi:hypothetical protein CRYUN_Cryun20dG0087700 [Craigia yunnanensis]